MGCRHLWSELHLTPTTTPLLLTLGYGKRTIDDTVRLLEQHGVRFLIDVRSAPWSRYHPDFSQDALEGHVEAHGIAYLYMGAELGGRPDDPDCYDDEGRVDYAACRRRPSFQHGIERLSLAWEQGQRVALLCSESRPQDCHRSKLLGVELIEQGIEVTHLDEDGTPLSQQEVMDRLSGGQLSLFGDLAGGLATRSRGRYRRVEQ